MDIDTKINRMAEMIFEGKDSPAVLAFYNRIKTMSGPFYSDLFYTVAGEVTYTKEPYGRDYWQTPDETLEGRGDCEDYAILLASASLHAKVPTRLKTVSVKGEYFDHVYPLFFDGKTWLVADATSSRPRLGEETVFYDERTYGINGGVYLIGEQLGSFKGSFLSYLFSFAVGMVVLGLILSAK